MTLETYNMTDQSTVPTPLDDAPDTDLGELLRAIIDDPNQKIDGCDVESYLSMLDDIDASETDKKELIHTLWSIIETIVLTQFRLDPASVATRLNGREPTQSSTDMVDLKSNPHKTFERVAACHVNARKKG